MLRSRRAGRKAIGAAAVMVALGTPLAMQAAGANELNSGATSLQTVGTGTTGAPYASGQSINVVVSANSTLSLSNLESNGYNGEPAIKMIECADPGGTTADLPTEASQCDGQTEATTSALNSDGSFEYDGYEMFALPDPNLGEKSNQEPVCGVGDNACVLSIGPAPTNFAQPHLFSAAFYVNADSADLGTNPGDGSPQQSQTITVSSTPSSPATIGGHYTPTATAPGGPVTVSTSSSSCSVSSGTVEFNSTGTCVIDFNQAGDFQYAPAPEATQDATVSQGSPQPQTITFTSTPPPNALPGGTYTPTATAPGGPVTFSVTGACSYAGGTVTFNSSGTSCVVDANQAGDALYAPAPTVSQTVAVGDMGFEPPVSATFTLDQGGSAPVNVVGQPKMKIKGKLPKGLKASKGVGSQAISGTPVQKGKKSPVGTYPLTVTATYGKGKTKQVLTETYTVYMVS